MCEQLQTAVSRHVVRKRVEQMVEMVTRLFRPRQSVSLLDVIPQGIGVKHESGARHDVGPVAGLVLLQQMQPWMFLALQPGDGAPHVRLQLLFQCRIRGMPGDEIHRHQPPQGGVDAAHVPEIRLVPFDVDILGNLAVFGLMPRQRQQAVLGALHQLGVAAQDHGQCTNGGISPKDTVIAPTLRLFGSRRRQNSIGRQITMKQPQCFLMTFLNHF
jgi:hypothetical protein